MISHLYADNRNDIAYYKCVNVNGFETINCKVRPLKGRREGCVAQW
jgi:hypothetical protein